MFIECVFFNPCSLVGSPGSRNGLGFINSDARIWVQAVLSRSSSTPLTVSIILLMYSVSLSDASLSFFW